MTANGRSRYAWRQRLILDRSLTLAEVRVLSRLEQFTDGSGDNAHPGAQLLSRDLGVSEKTVRRSLARGIELRFIERVDRPARPGLGHRPADVYRLVLDGPAASQRGAVLSGQSDVPIAGQQSGQPNVHKGEDLSGHSGGTFLDIPRTQTGHLNVQTPVPFTSPSTPEERSETLEVVEVVEDAVVIERSTQTGMDLVRSAMPRPGNPMQNALAKQADELLRGGTAPEVVETALRDWFSRPDARSAGLLPHLCSDVMKRAQPPVVPTGPVHGAATRKAVAYAAAAANVAERIRGSSNRDSSRPRIPPPRNEVPTYGGDLDAFARSLTRTPD